MSQLISLLAALILQSDRIERQTIKVNLLALLYKELFRSPISIALACLQVRGVVQSVHFIAFLSVFHLLPPLLFLLKHLNSLFFYV